MLQGRPLGEWTDLLLSVDEAGRDSVSLEHPADWLSRYAAETAAAADFGAELCRRLGYRDPEGRLDWGESDPDPPVGTTLYFESGSHIQDATYHSELRARHFSGEGAARVFGLRFSNFGRLLGFSYAPPDDVRTAIAELAGERGYVLVPDEVLEIDYPNRGFDTWWDRYFDYI